MPYKSYMDQNLYNTLTEEDVKIAIDMLQCFFHYRLDTFKRMLEGCGDALIEELKVSYEDLPLYLDSKSNRVEYVKWRLTIGK